MEISGKVKKIFDTQTKGTFVFREIVITTEEQYPQDIIIQFIQDKTELLNLYKPGDELKISINIRGKEWISPQGEIKYFNTIVGWRIERLAINQERNFNQIIPQNLTSSTPIDLQNDDDDLPF